jgi:catechol 2,3-dioxygenase-like lactoylglutathione lyase family enzyme
VNVERISAITLRVENMRASVRFYRDVLGLEITYGGEEAYFSSLRTKDGKNPILNLEQGKPATEWGRVIFYVVDVDGDHRLLSPDDNTVSASPGGHRSRDSPCTRWSEWHVLPAGYN